MREVITLIHDADLTATDRRCTCGRTFPSRTTLYRHIDWANGHREFPEDTALDATENR